MSIKTRNFDEKRNFIRMNISAPLTATLTVNNELFSGECLNLSGSGILVTTTANLKVGDRCQVEVSSGYGHKPTLRAEARVARRIEGAQEKAELGLEILEMIDA